MPPARCLDEWFWTTVVLGRAGGRDGRVTPSVSGVFLKVPDASGVDGRVARAAFQFADGEGGPLPSHALAIWVRSARLSSAELVRHRFVTKEWSFGKSKYAKGRFKSTFCIFQFAKGPFKSQTLGFQSQTLGLKPRASGFKSQTLGLKSRPVGFQSRPAGFQSQPSGFQPTAGTPHGHPRAISNPGTFPASSSAWAHATSSSSRARTSSTDVSCRRAR